MRSIWQRYDPLATDGDAGSTSDVCLHALCHYPPVPHHIMTLLTRRLYGNAGRGCARERLDAVFTWSQFGQHRGDGDDSSKCDCLERRRND